MSDELMVRADAGREPGGDWTVGMAPAAAVVGLVLATVMAWAWTLGPLRNAAWAWLGPATVVWAVLGLGGGVGAVLDSHRRPWFVVAALLCGLELATPLLASSVARHAVAQAQRYCERLAEDPANAGPPPALAEPGFSDRYPFRFDRYGGGSACAFPDPLAARAAWYGGSDALGGWHWEKLMD